MENSKSKSKETATTNLKARDSKNFLDMIHFEILYLCLLISNCDYNAQIYYFYILNTSNFSP